MGVIEFRPADQPNGSIEKAQLITEALRALRAAQQLNERDSLDLASWVAWYDATIPQVRDIKILAGAMEIELHRRRGEQILAEEERRGGDQKSDQIKVHHHGTLIQAERHRRHRARVIAAQPARVAAYVQHQVVAGCVPSVNGAVQAVKAPRSTSERAAGRLKAGKQRTLRAVEEWIRIVESVADGERRTDAQLIAKGFDVQHFFQHIRFLPWLAIDRTPAGTTFVIDQELRAICEARMPRPALGHQSIRAYLENLRSEIARKRKENHDEFRKRKWNSELILKREQSALLDWIDEQLLKVPN